MSEFIPSAYGAPNYALYNGGQYWDTQDGGKYLDAAAEGPYLYREEAPEGVKLSSDNGEMGAIMDAVVANCIAANCNTINRLATATNHGFRRSEPLYLPSVESYDDNDQPATVLWGNRVYSVEGAIGDDDLDVVAGVAREFGESKTAEWIKKTVKPESQDGAENIYNYSSIPLANGWRLELAEVRRTPWEMRGPNSMPLIKATHGELPSVHKELWLSPPGESITTMWHEPAHGKGTALEAVRAMETQFEDTQPIKQVDA